MSVFNLKVDLCTKGIIVYSLFQVWLHAPYELHLSLFEHFIELLTESRYEPMPA